jgi:ABC-type Fe2+-enterobactin transport system substrate-binding protein
MFGGPDAVAGLCQQPLGVADVPVDLFRGGLAGSARPRWKQSAQRAEDGAVDLGQGRARVVSTQHSELVTGTRISTSLAAPVRASGASQLNTRANSR